MFPALISGATVVLRTADPTLSPRSFTPCVAEQRITVLDLPTAYWHEWVQELPHTLNCPPCGPQFCYTARGPLCRRTDFNPFSEERSEFHATKEQTWPRAVSHQATRRATNILMTSELIRFSGDCLVRMSLSGIATILLDGITVVALVATGPDSGW